MIKNNWLKHYWPIACLICICVIIIPEIYAIQTGGYTFSEYIWHTTSQWGPLPAVAGLVIGFLICHFWWSSNK